MRKTHLVAHRLHADVIEGLERRVTEQGGLVKPPTELRLQEYVELRAIARDLIKHINALDEAI